MSSVSMSHSDIISLCRLCLAKDLASIDIFETGSEIRQLFTKIVACLPVQVMRDDSLPTKICEVCNSKVDDFYNFWSSTAKNQKQLNDWLSTATDEDPKTDQPTIKIEADDTRQDTDYENDYDDGGGDHDDSDYDAPNAKRIKINASDVEEDLKPEVDTILSEDLNGDQTPSTSTSKRKKSKDQKSKELTKPFKNLEVEVEVPIQRTCRICKEVQQNFTMYHKHYKEKHPGEKDFPCRWCDMSFPHKRQKYAHCNTAHKGLPTKPIFLCPKCNKKFINRDLYDDHLNWHEGIRTHACEICHASFKTFQQLLGHKVIHFERKKQSYQCQKCGKVFTSRSTYHLHRTKVHENKTWQCPICGKILVVFDRNHMRIHEKELKYVCETCGKRFNCPKYLKDHRLSHQAVKPYKCDFCEKRFTQRTPRSIHMRKFHTGVQPYECGLCNEKFASKDLLKKHIESHWKSSVEVRFQEFAEKSSVNI